MPHTADTVRGHMAHVASLPTSYEKKGALFDIIQQMITHSLDEQKALGVSVAQQAPFHDTIAMFNSIRGEVLAVDLS